MRNFFILLLSFLVLISFCSLSQAQLDPKVVLGTWSTVMQEGGTKVLIIAVFADDGTYNLTMKIGQMTMGSEKGTYKVSGDSIVVVTTESTLNPENVGKPDVVRIVSVSENQMTILDPEGQTLVFEKGIIELPSLPPVDIKALLGSWSWVIEDSEHGGKIVIILTFHEDTTYDMVMKFKGGTSPFQRGTFEVSGATITLVPTESSEPKDIGNRLLLSEVSVSGDTLSFINSDGNLQIFQRGVIEVPVEGSGSISGVIKYTGTLPYKIVAVAAFLVKGSMDESSVGGPSYFSFTEKAGPYTLSGLPDGEYYVVAWTTNNWSLGGGESQGLMGIYGFSPSDPSIPPKIVKIAGGSGITGIDIEINFSPGGPKTHVMPFSWGKLKLLYR